MNQAILPWAECPTLVHDLASNLTVGATDSTLLSECDRSSETQYFWYRETLDITSSISDPDGIRWWMFLCLLASWIMIYLIIMKGIESSGNVVYFTALFPYIVMTIFFIRGITLKGAGAGLAHMFYPKVLIWFILFCALFGTYSYLVDYTILLKRHSLYF